MGRLVKTHSTYLKGLIAILDLLVKLDGIKTITPGEIRPTRGNCEQLSIRISTKIISGYKGIARKGKAVQEIFIISNLKKEIIEKRIKYLLIENKKGYS